MTMINKTVLIVSAHADDHTISAGSVFKMQAKGYDAYEVLLTDSREGNDRRNGKLLTDQKEVVRLRVDEFDQASKFLNLKQKFIIGEPDLDLQFSKELMLRVVKVIREVKPSVIFTMNPLDYHKDHIAASHITEEASFWAATGIRPELGEPHRTNIVMYGEGMLPIVPDVLVDITEFQEKKLELFKIYASQANSKAVHFTDALARVRGYHIRKQNEEFAEAFTLNKKFPSLLLEEL